MAVELLEGSIDAVAALIAEKEARAAGAVEQPAPAPEPKQEIQPQPSAEAEPAENAAVDPAEAEPGEVTNPVVTEPAKVAAVSPEVEQLRKDAEKAQQEAIAAKTQLASHVNNLNILVPQLEAQIAGEFQDLKNIDDVYALMDPNSPKYDPTRYNRLALANYKLQMAQNARNEAQAAQKQQQQTERQKFLTSEWEKLCKALPEFADASKAPTLTKQLQDYAEKKGISTTRLADYTAAEFVALHQLMNLDKLEEKRIEAQRKAAKAPPVQKPGAARNVDSGKEDKLSELRERFKKTGRQDDLAAYLSAKSG